MEGAMFNFKKIALIMLVAALFCALQIGTSYAQEILPNNTGEYNYGGDWMGNNNFLKNIPGSNSGSSLEDCKKIILLKRFGFTLEEIKTMLNGSISEQILEDKQLELQEEIREKQQIVYEIEIMKDELTKQKEKEPQKVYRMERELV